jgi:dUTPase
MPLTNNPMLTDHNLKNLLNIYDRVMILKLYVDNDNELKNLYLAAAENHNKKMILNPEFIDAGFDLFAPGNKGQELDNYGDQLRFFSTGWNLREPVNKVDFNVCCSAQILTSSGRQFNTGYYLHPRSSLSKTRLRLANSTGIIDAGYRGHIMAMFDVVNITENEKRNSDRECDYYGEKFDRYAQLCAPGLMPILVEVVNKKDELGMETERGSGGFGSTGR